MPEFEFPDDTMAGRIERQLAEIGRSAASVSEEATGKKDAIRKIYDKARKGEEFNPRMDTLQGLARVLGRSVDWLSEGADENGSTLGPPMVRSGRPLPFAGFAQAGQFLAVDEYFQQDEYPVPEFVLPVGTYSKVRQYVYQARGRSMEDVGIVEGDWVVAADAVEFIDTYGETQSGDLVVVERTRFQGAERELAVKEVHYFRDRYELRPRSKDAAFKPIIVPLNGPSPSSDEFEVKIIGVVLTSYRDHRKRR